VLALLIEGLESAWLPCSLILLVPGVAVLLASPDRVVTTTSSFFAASAALAWARFSERGGDWPIGLSAIALMSAAVLLLAPVIDDRAAAGWAARLRAAVGGVLAGVASAELWEPCVGAEFGSLLNDLANRGLGGIVPTFAYVVGVLAPLIALASLIRLLPNRLIDPARTVMAVVGGAVLTVMAVATAIGFHDELVDRLIRSSL